MKGRLTFRALIALLFIATLIPLLLLVGLVVYRLQQAYLLDNARDQLVNSVQSQVEQFEVDTDPTELAVNLGESLRSLGADLFIQNAAGEPVPPSLGTGPWMSNSAHREIRQAVTSQVEVIGSGQSARIVYLTAVVEPSGDLLGSVEASLPLAPIQAELDALRRWLTLIVGLASALAAVIAVVLSGIITRPLNSLVESVETVRQGNLQARAPVPEIQELGRLAVTYNQMLDQIEGDLDQQAHLAESMRQFAADASHELRSPLSVFRNSVEMLEKAFTQQDEKLSQDILALQRNEVDTMTSLVENLLLLARLDQPPADAAALLNREEIDPYPLLEEVYERSLVLAKGQEIVLAWPSGPTGTIFADRAMLRRALNNVVENAIRHTPAGKRVNLSLENSPDECIFLVEDQGSGIPPEQLARIFDRFYRGDEARSRQTAGSGLGLAIVAAIVRVHNGDVKVESRLGTGTRIRLIFPVVQAEP